MAREAGRVSVHDPGADGALLEQATYQCCHCGKHFAAKPDLFVKLIDAMNRGGLTKEEAAHLQTEGRSIRGWCGRCCGPVCGPGCADCVPMELQIENMEKGRPTDYVPIVVPVWSPPP